MPRTELVNQQIREEQRANILRAAKEVFARRGSSATMAEIAERAGVSQGLAYRYFESKDEIFAFLLKQTMESSEEYDVIIKKLPGTASERLQQIITRLLELRRERPGYYQLLYQLLSDGKTPKEIRGAITRRGTHFRSELRKLIVEGQRSGTIADDNPDQLLEAVMGAMEGLWRRMAYDPESAMKNFPSPKIILRMLRPDRPRRD